MSMFTRLFTPPSRHSFFLFGARGTGKSTLLRRHFSNSLEVFWVDLLDFETEDSLLRNPAIFDQQLNQLGTGIRWIVVDEVQKIPKLLDLIHRWIEKKRFFFALTGSSARKLKRGSANLLAGRAYIFELFPLTHRELGKQFELAEVLRFGCLPEIFQNTDEKERIRFLQAYTRTYLKEEIIAEQLIRKVASFRRFLDIAAQMSGEIINFSSIAQDVGIDRISVQTYFEILEETLMGQLLEPYHRSIRKRQRHNPKFYFFDLGVKHAIEGRLSDPLHPRTYEFGKAFEHFVMNEIFRLVKYKEEDWRFSYLRTKDNAEIDLLIERANKVHFLIEIKSTNQVKEREVTSLQRFTADFPKARALCLSLDPIAKRIGKVECLNWKEGIKEIAPAP